jgi:hypothetical protein
MTMLLTETARINRSLETQPPLPQPSPLRRVVCLEQQILPPTHGATSIQPGLKQIKAPTSFQQLADWYFEPRAWEKDGTTYRSMGVEQFRKLLFAMDRFRNCLLKVPLYRKYVARVFGRQQLDSNNVEKLTSLRRTRQVRSDQRDGCFMQQSNAGIRSFITFTKRDEAIHLVSAATLNTVATFALVSGHPLVAGGIFTLSVFTDLYPIALQRYNRTRLCKALEKIERRNSLAVSGA